MVGSILCIIPAQRRSSMKSSTMTSLPLSGAKGHDDGGWPDAGVPQASRETGMANRKQGITRELAYLTSQHGRRAQEKPKKGQILGETKPFWDAARAAFHVILSEAKNLALLPKRKHRSEILRSAQNDMPDPLPNSA